jgi:hypothetical protein
MGLCRCLDELLQISSAACGVGKQLFSAITCFSHLQDNK